MTIRHLDFYSQALAKVSRDIVTDASDVAALLDAGLISAPRAWELYEAIVPGMRAFRRLTNQASDHG